MKKNMLVLILLLLGFSLAAYLLFGVGNFFRVPPPGVPIDYFDYTDYIDRRSDNVLIYTKTIDLDYVDTSYYRTYSNISLYSTKYYKFIIIDVDAMGEISSSESETLLDLVENHCYQLILLNMSGYYYDSYSSLVSSRNSNEKFILVSNSSCGGQITQSVIDTDYDSDAELQYAIVTVIAQAMGADF